MRGWEWYACYQDGPPICTISIEVLALLALISCFSNHNALEPVLIHDQLCVLTQRAKLRMVPVFVGSILHCYTRLCAGMERMNKILKAGIKDAGYGRYMFYFTHAT